MMKLTDYIANRLAENGVRCAFGVTGGGIVHMFDSLEKQPEIKVVYQHHEQAASFAAEGASSYSGVPALCVVTTGPGGTNAITGALGAYLDSTPCLFISGQARTDHMSAGTNLRQRGTQEFDIGGTVKSVVKEVCTLSDPLLIRYELERLWHLSMAGRPGPVWLEIPLNFQWVEIEPDQLKGYHPHEFSPPAGQKPSDFWGKLSGLLNESKSPLILAGRGIRLSGARDALVAFADLHHIPIACTWAMADQFDYNDPRCVGRVGMAGQRGANMAVNNCDLLLSIGTHIPIPVSGNRRDQFAINARLVMVNIDGNELRGCDLNVDLLLESDAGEFFQNLKKYSHVERKTDQKWLDLCREYKALNEYFYHWENQDLSFSHYRHMKILSKCMSPVDDLVIDGGGFSNFVAYQSFENKYPQRMILTSGLCSMGSGLPAAIGVAFSKKEGATVLVCGDGSFQFNIQELQTIAHHSLNLKIIIADNSGYLSIRGTQSSFLGGRYFGSSQKGGLSLPDYTKIAEAYGIRAARVDSIFELEEHIRTILQQDGPSLTVVCVDPEEKFNPRQRFVEMQDGTYQALPLDDMEPQIPRDLYENLQYRT